ncbi:hypothetical protein Y032_0053g2309 [Ancylostoma ceylanicum]|uniref:Uncharacterized protein n=1 Tax=Ancylostoma ceylanicum TaxID=53326 RepID=A0A016U7A4_9BILA|nr:hypothetical protein Y032_0053g2309 [Ancylostoma ceylanicum]
MGCVSSCGKKKKVFYWAIRRRGQSQKRPSPYFEYGALYLERTARSGSVIGQFTQATNHRTRLRRLFQVYRSTPPISPQDDPYPPP